MKKLYLLLLVVPGLVNAAGWLGRSDDTGTAQGMRREGQMGMRNNGGQELDKVQSTATGTASTMGTTGTEAGQGAMGDVTGTGTAGETATGTEQTGSTTY